MTQLGAAEEGYSRDGRTPSIWRLTKLATSSAEDRLTEALALVLFTQGITDDFMRFIASLVDLDWGQVDGAEARPQEQILGSQMRVDLALQAPKHSVWIEAKLDSRQRENQLLDYAQGLSRLRHGKAGGEGILVFLTRAGAGASDVKALTDQGFLPEIGVRVIAMSWEQVGTWLAENGDRMGHSFMDYLTRENAIVNPVSAQDPSLLANLSRIKESWWVLVETVRNQVSSNWIYSTEVSRPTSRAWRDCPQFNLNFSPESALWPGDVKLPHAWLELRLSDVPPQPQFRCGLTLVDNELEVEETFPSEVLDVVASALGGRFAEASVSVAEDKGRLSRVEVAKAITEIEGGSVVDQGSALADWVNQVFEVVVDSQAMEPLRAAREK